MGYCRLTTHDIAADTIPANPTQSDDQPNRVDHGKGHMP